MSELRRFLGTVDEEYLIGLSNKGIVKRSYKDLENTAVEITEEGEEIRGTCGDAQVVLRLPLTNSTCSCPSTSICKHVIMTILAAKNGCGEEKEPSAEAKAEDQGEAKVQTQEDAAPEEDLSEKILQVPVEKLKKALAGRDWIKLLTQTDFSEDFEIRKEKLITVRNVKTNATVKASSQTASSISAGNSRTSVSVSPSKALRRPTMRSADFRTASTEAIRLSRNCARWE